MQTKIWRFLKQILSEWIKKTRMRRIKQTNPAKSNVAAAGQSPRRPKNSQNATSDITDKKTWINMRVTTLRNNGWRRSKLLQLHDCWTFSHFCTYFPSSSWSVTVWNSSMKRVNSSNFSLSQPCLYFASISLSSFSTWEKSCVYSSITSGRIWQFSLK